MLNTNISVVIPAYNEENRVGVVIEAVKKSSLINEIIVVDDGSADNTAKIAAGYGVKTIKMDKNSGKGAAMQIGIKAVSHHCDIVLFIDADLVGLNSGHIDSLISPLITDLNLAMTVGKFTGGRLATDLAQKIVPQISGQRAIRIEYAKKLPDLTKVGFGVEVFITSFFKKSGFLVQDVLLKNVTQVMKEEKLGLRNGTIARVKMYRDMAKTFFKTKFSL